MISERSKFSTILRDLFLEGLEPPGELTWLEESYRKPEGFWQTLKQAQDSSLPWPGKSTPFGKYDFYHDIIIRNLNNTAPAFCWYDSVLGTQEISYAELGVLATAKEAAWMLLGIQPGQKVCIVLPLGVQYVVSFLAALKIGLTVSFLPPQGKIFLQRRLEALAPDHIVTDEMYFPLLPAWRERILAEEASAQNANTNPEHSYAYPSGAVSNLCFDPSSETSHIPRELTSDAAYLCPLRDGMIALGLKPGHVLAAPGFHYLETLPGLLLAALLNGATYLHLEPDEVSKHPELLNGHSIQAMGISEPVRDALLKKPVVLDKPWDFWFRNPAESSDIEQWQSFIQTLGLAEAYSGNLKWDAALGGCSLFSVKRKQYVHLNVLPSAGVPWGLANLAGGDLESLVDCGFFSPVVLGRQDGEKTVTASILAIRRQECLFVGSRVSGRAGKFYPGTEILEAIRNLPYGSLCSIAQIPPFGAGAKPVFVLLVFTGGKPAQRAAGITKEILQFIEREMGKEFSPDRIQFFPLYPRRDAEGIVDHNWCRDQYLTGGLFRKSQEETYRCLTQLRQYLD